MNRSRKVFKETLLLCMLLFFVSVSFFIALRIGAVSMSLGEIIGILFMGEESTNRAILLDIRLPRVLVSAVLGAGLSAVGGVMQGIFKTHL